MYVMSSFAIPPRFFYLWNLPVLLTILSPCDWFYYTHRAKPQPKINECAFSIPSSRLLLENTKKNNNKTPITIGTKTFLMQGNHNFTRHALYKVCPNKQANEGIWPMEKRLFPLHKGASPQAMNPYKCAHQQKTLVSKPQRCVTALPSILFLSLDRSIPFFIAKFFRDYLICLTYCGLTYVSTTLKLLFPKHPKSPSC